MLKISLVFLTLLGGLSTFAKAKKDSYPLLTKSLSKYRAAGLVQADLTKTLKSELTGTENKYTGKIFLASGLFRLEQIQPEKSVLVFDGQFLWNEQSAPIDFPGPAQVSKLKIGTKDKSQILFASLLTKEPLTKHFKIISEKSGEKETIYIAEPLQADVQIKKLNVKIDNVSKNVNEISYLDDVENMTVMQFSNVQFKKSNSKVFKYQAPKGAQVTEIKTGEK